MIVSSETYICWNEVRVRFYSLRLTGDCITCYREVELMNEMIDRFH